MKVTMKQAFSILDGRLSTRIDDVYEMLNYIFSDQLYTHQLPGAMRTLRDISPEWYQKAWFRLNQIKSEHNTNDFDKLMVILDCFYDQEFVNLGKIEAQISFFGEFKNEEK